MCSAEARKSNIPPLGMAGGNGVGISVSFSCLFDTPSQGNAATLFFKKKDSLVLLPVLIVPYLQTG